MNRTGWLLCGALLMAGCAAASAMRSHVPAHCHGASAPFTTFAIEQVEVPGFMTPVLADALEGALLLLATTLDRMLRGVRDPCPR